MATLNRFLGPFSPVLACKMCSIKNIALLRTLKKSLKGVEGILLKYSKRKKFDKTMFSRKKTKQKLTGGTEFKSSMQGELLRCFILAEYKMILYFLIMQCLKLRIICDYIYTIFTDIEKNKRAFSGAFTIQDVYKTYHSSKSLLYEFYIIVGFFYSTSSQI